MAHYILVLNTEDAVRYFEGHGLNMSVTLQAALGPHQAGRSVEGGLRISLATGLSRSASGSPAPQSPGEADDAALRGSGSQCGSTGSLSSLGGGGAAAASSPPTRVTATYVYGQSAGFFLGAGLQGGVVAPRTWENSAYYGVPDARAEDILAGRIGLHPGQERPEVAALHAVLAKAQDGHAEWRVGPDAGASSADDGGEADDQDRLVTGEMDGDGAPDGVGSQDPGKPPRGRGSRPPRGRGAPPGEDAERGEFELFVPGRVCLFGEHSDWAGGLRSPAHPHIAPGATLVVGLAKEGLHARARRRTGTLLLRSVLDHGEVLGPVEFPMDVGALLTRAAEGGFWSYACGVAAKLMSMFDVGGLEIDNYRTTLPVRKGLSSSAAMCVLVARAFSRAYGLGLSVRGEMELAYQGEICTPSACGRMDQACAYGPRPVLMRYDGDAMEVDELAVGAPLHYVIADLNASKSTVAIIEALRGAFPLPQSAAHEGVQQLLGPLNLDITARAVAAVALGDAAALGALMVEAQALFDRHGSAVCPEELTAPVLHRVLADERLRPHVHGGKGVGSQGDGCVQFLCKSLAAQAQAAAILRDQLGLTTLELTIEPTIGEAGDNESARSRWLAKTRERIEVMRISSAEKLQALRLSSGDAWARATQPVPDPPL